jgi:1,4-alpha-glucan branching enzyme
MTETTRDREKVKVPTASMTDIEAIAGARHWDPFSVLGPHPVRAGDETLLAIRAFVPGAEAIRILPKGSGESIETTEVHPAGFFEAVIGPVGTDFRYRLRIQPRGGAAWECEDPYRFGRVLTDFDVYLLAEGTHYQSFEKLGAHALEIDGVRGVHFAVWAPNAERVSVVGSFNGWDGRRNPMRNLGTSGLWEMFLPGLAEGDLYKFEIRSRGGGTIRLKSDPYAFYSEMRPGTASIVYDLASHRGEWHDHEWLAHERMRRNAFDAPISIYEVHLGSWMRGDGSRYLTYRELADRLIPYVKDLGFTHIELLPILEHPFDASWGYQALGYFAPTSRLGSPQDFAAFVNACHVAGIGVFLDWVPAHFPRDDHGLRLFDGTHLYEHADPRLGEHRDWGTLIFNYGRHEVRNFLLGNALFWLNKYHLDGLRVDAVASMLYLDYSRNEGEWIPNEYGGRENLAAIDFLKKLNELCHTQHPGVLTIAEESTAWPGVTRPPYVGGLGFSLKWNMGWMNDTLEYFSHDPVHRKYHHRNLTFSMLYAFSENFVLPLSHDEVVHGKRSLLDKMPGDGWQKFANLRLLLAFQHMMPGKKLLFMGSEFGQGQEWNCEQSLDWHLLGIDYHRGIQNLVRDLNRLLVTQPALHQIDFDWRGFEWIDLHDWEGSIISFVRRGRDPGEEVVVVLNFTPVARHGYRVGMPGSGFYHEILNTDSEHYSGSNVGNAGGLRAEQVATHGRPWSLSLNVPPLAVLAFKRG